MILYKLKTLKSQIINFSHEEANDQRNNLRELQNSPIDYLSGLQMHISIHCALLWTTLHRVIALSVHCQHVRVGEKVLNQNRLGDQNLIVRRLLYDHSCLEAG